MGIELVLFIVAWARAACLKTAYATFASAQFCRSGSEFFMPAYLFSFLACKGGWVGMYFFQCKLSMIYMYGSSNSSRCSNLLSRVATACMMMHF